MTLAMHLFVFLQLTKYHITLVNWTYEVEEKSVSSFIYKQSLQSTYCFRPLILQTFGINMLLLSVRKLQVYDILLIRYYFYTA